MTKAVKATIHTIDRYIYKNLQVATLFTFGKITLRLTGYKYSFHENKNLNFVKFSITFPCCLVLKTVYKSCHKKNKFI